MRSWYSTANYWRVKPPSHIKMSTGQVFSLLIIRELTVARDGDAVTGSAKAELWLLQFNSLAKNLKNNSFQ